MNFSSLTFILTSQCNFACQYCFQNRLDPTPLKPVDAFRAIDFLYPFLTEKSHINFYGGEPLLAFDSIRQIVRYINNKRKNYDNTVITFTLTTNGSLLDDQVIEFLGKNAFQVMVSFDGTAQEINRQPGSYQQVMASIEKLHDHPNIHLELNSVFAANTLPRMSESIIHNIHLGVPHIHFSVDKTRPLTHRDLDTYHKQLVLLKLFLVDYYHHTQRIPVKTFQPRTDTGPSWCAGGTNQMALAPDGLLWGCHLFYDYFNGRRNHPEFSKYCFGHIDDFSKRYKKIYPETLGNYRNLKQQGFWCSSRLCVLCEELDECRICPMDAAFSGSIIGRVPEWSCQINQILIRERRDFFARLKELDFNKVMGRPANG